MRPQKHRIEIRAKRVDVVEEQRPQGGLLPEQAGQRPVPEQVRDLVEVTHRMQALERQVVGIITGLTG